MSTPSSAVAGGAAALRGLAHARVFLPEDAGYERLRLPWNLSVDQRPAAVAVPENVAGVVEVVRAAAAEGLRVVPQGTGHGAAPLAGRTSDAVLLRLSSLRGATVDAERGLARVLGGTRWQQVVDAAAAHGLAGMHGSGPDIAVAGYTLGGGLSWYGRAHGLACNRVRAAEVVLADGRLTRVHQNSDPELFWALRGGGGGMGVVTAVDLELLPFDQVTAGVMVWDAGRATEVCRAWADWTHGLAEEVTTSLRLLGRPGQTGAHHLFPGRQVVVVDGAALADTERAAHWLAPLRRLRPEIDTFGPMPVREVTRLHFDPELPSPTVTDTVLLDDFDAAAADALVSLAGDQADTTLLSAEIRHLGGALGRPDPDGGALDHLRGGYAGWFLAGAATPELRAQGSADAARLVDALGPWSSGRRLLNFTDAVVDAASAYDPDTLARLRSVRSRVDPDRMFVANHEVG